MACRQTSMPSLKFLAFTRILNRCFLWCIWPSKEKFDSVGYIWIHQQYTKTSQKRYCFDNSNTYQILFVANVIGQYHDEIAITLFDYQRTRYLFHGNYIVSQVAGSVKLSVWKPYNLNGDQNDKCAPNGPVLKAFINGPQTINEFVVFAFDSHVFLHYIYNKKF